MRKQQILCSCLLLLTGCGQSTDEMALTPMSGTITYQGTPIEEGVIRLVPQEGSSAPGKAAQAMVGGAPFGEGALTGLNTLNPFKGSKSMAPAQALYGVEGGTKQFANVQDAKAYQSLFPDAKITELPASEAPKDFLASGLQKMQGEKTGMAAIGDCLYGDAAGANFKVTAAAAGADFITQVAMGAYPMDAAKDAGKTAVLSYVANAILPGYGPIVGFLSKFF